MECLQQILNNFFSSFKTLNNFDFLKTFFFRGCSDQKLCFFDQIEDNVSWPPCYINHFSKWEHLLTPIWVTDSWNSPQMDPNIVLYGKFSQPYSQYTVQARASSEAVYPLYNVHVLRRSWWQSWKSFIQLINIYSPPRSCFNPLL